MKSILNVTGFRDVKNIHSINARSIPKIMRSSYLELYLLKKEMDRLEKEIFLLDKKRNNAGAQLEIIGKQVKKLHKEILAGQKRKSVKTSSAGQIRSIPIRY